MLPGLVLPPPRLLPEFGVILLLLRPPLLLLHLRLPLLCSGLVLLWMLLLRCGLVLLQSLVLVLCVRLGLLMAMLSLRLLRPRLESLLDLGLSQAPPASFQTFIFSSLRQ